MSADTKYEYVVHWTKADGRDWVRDHRTYESRKAARQEARDIAAEQEAIGLRPDVRVTKRKAKS